MRYKKVVNKLDDFIRRKIDEKTEAITSLDAHVRLEELRNKVKRLESEIERLAGLFDMIWGLPMFKPYRGKK